MTVSSLQARSSTVGVERPCRRPPRAPALTAVFAAVGVVLGQLDRGHVAAQQRRDGVRVLLQELGAHDQVRGDELAVRPQVLLVDQHLAAALEDQPGGLGLGHPGAVELAALEQVEDVARWPSA